jgi:hypothetical protein
VSERGKPGQSRKQTFLLCCNSSTDKGLTWQFTTNITVLTLSNDTFVQIWTILEVYLFIRIFHKKIRLVGGVSTSMMRRKTPNGSVLRI